MTKYYKKYTPISKTPPYKNGTQHKWHLTTCITNILLIELTHTVRHMRLLGISPRSRNLTLNSHDHESESYSKFKNFLLKIIDLSPWQIILGYFLARCAIFVNHHVFWVSSFSISGRVIAMCCFSKVPLSLNDIKWCHFCRLYLTVVKL